MATIGLTNDAHRQLILTPPSHIQPFDDSKDEFPLITILSRSITHTHLGVRYSALQLVRVLARSLAILRTGLFDSDIPVKVLGIVSEKQENPGEQEHRAVLIAALMALCNIVNGYAPFRQVASSQLSIIPTQSSSRSLSKRRA